MKKINHTMKKKNISRCLLSILLLFASMPSFTANSKPVCQEPAPIVINPIKYNPNGGPRSDSPVPFTAFRSGCYVTISSSVDCGVVEVELESTAGDSYCNCFDTAEGLFIIPISGDVGEYVLTITVQDGMVFMGEFEII